MDKQFGLTFLLQTYLGIASNVVQPGQREERKSIGSERYLAFLLCATSSPTLIAAKARSIL